MTDIYKQHDAAFAQVAAYVVMRGTDRVATIAFKFPRDGAGRLYAYVHWIGCEMVRGQASGYGYDKRSAACAHAASKMAGKAIWDGKANNGFGGFTGEAEPMTAQQVLFHAALRKDDGMGWDRNLRDAGFEIWQAV